MIAGIIIVVLLVLYCAWVIRRKVRQVKNGQYCSCGCAGCTKNCGTNSKK